VAKALLGAFVQRLFRDRDLNFNLHGTPLYARIANRRTQRRRRCTPIMMP
jgi:hypothetical protein